MYLFIRVVLRDLNLRAWVSPQAPDLDGTNLLTAQGV